MFSPSNVCLQDSAKLMVREEIGPQICGPVDTLKGEQQAFYYYDNILLNISESLAMQVTMLA